MKVMMVPHWLNIKGHEPSGIKSVVESYSRHFPAAGIELVSPKATSFDLLAVHAGMTKDFPNSAPLCAMLHGLYWTSDYNAAEWEYKVNRDVIDSIRHATAVTVPSEWVAEPFRRDLHLSPHVVPHGIDWQDWQHSEPNEGYILGYAKNRTNSDVCNPMAMGELAQRFPRLRFLGTFAPPNPTPNIKATGLVAHAEMRRMVQRAAVLVSSVKETFGVLHLEALASGVPVLGFRQGGILETVEHGVNGYLARPGDYDDLGRGLEYCLKYRDILGANGRETAKRFTWQRVAEQLHGIYADAIEQFNQPATVSVIVPCYNYAHTLERAVLSAVANLPHEIIIVDNNSTDDTAKVAQDLAQRHPTVRYVNEPAQGVAHARNRGIREATGKYILPLDADDTIEPGFVDACLRTLEADPSLGVAYTRLRWVKADGTTGLSDWPGEYDYDEFLRRKNQVPTCAMYRREMALRLGGYRQRYAPHGAGAEDAEFFLRAGAIGYGAKLATQEPLFVYSWGTGRVSGNRDYKEPNWTSGKPWIEDKQHPFASVATPSKRSHPVRQYDEPVVSVVIPCGPDHQQYLVDALDSLEAQTYRKWEVIVVFDNNIPLPSLLTAYPFMRWEYLSNGGAGAARNLGASKARAGLLLFLDADDWLRPNAIARLLMAWNRTQGIAYSDYAGHAYIDDRRSVEELRSVGRLESYDEATKMAVVRHQSAEFDCQEAIRQPRLQHNGEFYIWNLITSLVPKAWHDEIGGFDEQMESWEDWDYWIRLARAGKCFTRVPEPLVDYRFFSGTRREQGRQKHKSLVDYMASKYRETEAMLCSSCGGAGPAAGPPASVTPQMSMQMNANDLLWVRLNDGNEGQHPIIGRITRTNYGYRSHGDVFKMMSTDVNAVKHLFVIVDDPDAVPMATPVAPAIAEPPAPTFTAWPEEPKPVRKSPAGRKKL